MKINENIKHILRKFSSIPQGFSRHTAEAHIIGHKSAVVEGCLHIVDYDEENIRLRTKSGDIAFFGARLSLRFLDSECTEIFGDIQRVEFL